MNANPDNFIHKLDDVNETNTVSKISVFGCNSVSVNIVATMVLEKIPADIYIFDENQLELDVHFSDFKYFKVINCKLNLSCVTDIKKTATSDICVICFGCKNTGDIGLEHLFQNLVLYEKYVPQIVKYSPRTIIIVATHPFSVMTYFCVKFSKIHENRVLGLGATMSSNLFRYILANDLNISITHVRGRIIGCAYYEKESGKVLSDFFPLWSTVSIGSINIEDLIDLSFKENFYRMVMVLKNLKATYDIKPSLKYTIGPVVCLLIQAILKDSQISYSISCNVKGFHGVHFTAYMGLPCIIGRNGYQLNVKINLLQIETDELRKGAGKVFESNKFLQKKYAEYKKRKEGQEEN